MNVISWTVFTRLSLCNIILISSLMPSWAAPRHGAGISESNPAPTIAETEEVYPTGIPVTGCTLQPKRNPPQPNIETRFVSGPLTLSRFRKPLAPIKPVAISGVSPQVLNFVRRYQPRERVALAHPTNFGERYLRDLNGRTAYREPIIVLHETVSSGESAIRFFQTPHPKDEDQASYHALIRLDGSIDYLVPPDKRAYGAGQSVFVHPRTGRTETIKTNPSLSPSVNNFAYHISFETPPAGRNGGLHEDYTAWQYYSLAWLVAKTGVPEDRITTHKAVDRSGTRADPRQFDRAKFMSILRIYPKTNEVKIGCR